MLSKILSNKLLINAAMRNFLLQTDLYQLLQLSSEKICFKSGEYFELIKYGTFIHVREYDQRVVGDTPKSTIRV